MAEQGAGQLPGQITTLSVEAITPSPFQPRKKFDNQALQELAASIRAEGLLQPITVRPGPDGRYELVTGERRLRAVRLNGRTEIAAVIRMYSDKEAAKATFVENLQREDLTVLEQAHLIQGLVQKGFSLQEVTQDLGKSLGYLQVRLNALKLPEVVQTMLDEGKITLAHVDILLELGSADGQVKAAHMAWKQHLTATQLLARTQHMRKSRTSGEKGIIGHGRLSKGLLSLHADLQLFHIDAEVPKERRLVLAKQINVVIKALKEAQRRLGLDPHLYDS